MSEPLSPGRATGLRARILALLAVPLLLVACVQVPASGPVEAGDEIAGAADSDADILQVPDGPSAGASQEEVLRGFLAAAAGAQNNYRIARSFLVDETATAWNPQASTLVRSREGTITRDDDDTLRYAAPIIAAVDAFGRYSSAEGGVQELEPFDFVEVDGEWRISALGDGILLSQQAFPGAFSQHTLHWFDPVFENLVPELRWFPSRSEVETSIVQALLDVPSPWLQGAVVSAVPEGAQLGLTTVEITDGVASVDLTDEVLGLTNDARQRLRQQLTASLRAVSGIASVQITVDQNPIAILGDPAAGPAVVPQVDARLLLRDEEEFGFAGGGGLEALPGISAAVIGLEADAVALSYDERLAAIRTPAGVSALREGSDEPVLIDARPGQIEPAIDGFGVIWSASTDAAASSPGALRVSLIDGSAQAVETGLGAGDRLVELAVARDDARVLLLLDGSTGPRLVVAAVIRDETTGLPLRLGPFETLPIVEGAPIDAAWVDPVRVAALVDADESAFVQLIEIGGRSRSLGRPSNAVQIVGGNNGVDGLRVLDSAGLVLEPRGSGWQPTGREAVFLGVQQ
ncbi:LpqB family beta-propeller domain-containing protein [Microcella daejeonensis]|uniref:LpqB family beta-propeller domain-containing protein n=2 Tax=Microcella daejeonensis TaxID=2994971 RepID=A0A9E8MLI7_9MICO|nr:LpqB family beta-propeller domain-containing protein [Microcella daejeonensis]WAB81835.1 LpqB family beta-propeller domain-containing protein [Microcella daejeonensis]